MKIKHVKLEETTRVLLNECKGNILRHNPKIKKLTDDLTIRIITKQYLEGKLWNKPTTI